MNNNNNIVGPGGMSPYYGFDQQLMYSFAKDGTIRDIQKQIYLQNLLKVQDPILYEKQKKLNRRVKSLELKKKTKEYKNNKKMLKSQDEIAEPIHITTGHNKNTYFGGLEDRLKNRFNPGQRNSTGIFGNSSRPGHGNPSKPVYGNSTGIFGNPSRPGYGNTSRPVYGKDFRNSAGIFGPLPKHPKPIKKPFSKSLSKLFSKTKPAPVYGPIPNPEVPFYKRWYNNIKKTFSGSFGKKTSRRHTKKHGKRVHKKSHKKRIHKRSRKINR